ncbi:hypothetical protein L873DRAFT_836736 [Choiromyces venosus 120613-1]|uniref:Uncharacterized protein n=1 Tax=Choiromyces venosus 120613-1 TaxID=1336337 RepID=A0A3N4K2S0_9PEZI|nr:hypothetical protein L873DRAFT_836736 [Choiromyces venosus 120613-1]
MLLCIFEYTFSLHCTFSTFEAHFHYCPCFACLYCLFGGIFMYIKFKKGFYHRGEIIIRQGKSLELKPRGDDE